MANHEIQKAKSVDESHYYYICDQWGREHIEAEERFTRVGIKDPSLLCRSVSQASFINRAQCSTRMALMRDNATHPDQLIEHDYPV